MQGAHSEVCQIKDHPYEESVGVPLVIMDPRRPERQGLALDLPTCSEDLLPTILGMAGLTAPARLPGQDLSPVIRGERETLDRPGVLLEYVHDLRVHEKDRPYGDTYWRAFRSHQYKYTVLGGAKGGRPWQFFDLRTDPMEMNNLIQSPAHRDLIAQHHLWLYERMKETEDHFVLPEYFGCPGLNLWQSG